MFHQRNVYKPSKNFPGLPLTEIIPQYLEENKIVGRNSVIKAFRCWVTERIKTQN